MKSLYRFIFSIFFLSACFLSAHAQDKIPSDTIPVADTLRQEKPAADTLRQQNVQKKERKTDTTEVLGNISFYIDYLKFVSPAISNSRKYEGGITLNIYNGIHLAAEAGYGLLRPETAIRNGTFQAEGRYGRVGINFTILNNKNSNIYLGGRYCKSFFDAQGTYAFESPLWGEYERSYAYQDLEAEWFEVLIGTEGEIFAGFYLGWIARMRSLLEYPDFEIEKVFNIPGYGRSVNSQLPAINLYLKYKIDW